MSIKRSPFQQAKKPKADQVTKSVDQDKATDADGSQKTLPVRYVEPMLWRVKDAKFRVSIGALLICYEILHKPHRSPNGECKTAKELYL